jgi:hypothetical protein
MKKALIDENSIVAQVETVPFDIAPPCFWVDCADNVIPYEYKYENDAVVPIPEPAPVPPTAVENQEMARQKLTNSDWAVLPDVNLQNKTDWVTYRSALRAIAINPQPGFLIWPTKPQEVWN